MQAQTSVQDEIEITGEPTAVYRFYDAAGALLYIGMTQNIAVRFAQHAIDKTWWPLVARKTMIWYGSRPEAAATEMAAILSEAPLRNFEGKSSEDEYGAEAMRRRDKITVSLTHVLRSEPETVIGSVVPRLPATGLAALPPLTPPPSAPMAQNRGERRPDSDLRRRLLVYVTIADGLAAKIDDGIYPPGSRLPSVADLVYDYGAARDTVRRAIRELAEQGYVEVVPGKGVYVVPEHERTAPS